MFKAQIYSIVSKNSLSNEKNHIASGEIEQKKGITILANHNAPTYKCKFKGNYLIKSMLLFTKLFKASPFSIPFCSSARSIS